MTDKELFTKVSKLLDLQRKYCMRMIWQNATFEKLYKELFKKVSDEVTRRETEIKEKTEPKLF